MKKLEKKAVDKSVIVIENGYKFLFVAISQRSKIFLGEENCDIPEWYVFDSSAGSGGMIAFDVTHSAVVSTSTPKAIRVVFSSGVVMTVSDIWKMKNGYVVNPLGHAPLQYLNFDGYVLATLGTYPDYHIIDVEDRYVLAKENNASDHIHVLSLDGDEVVLEGKYAMARITLPVISAYKEVTGQKKGDIFLPDGTFLKENVQLP